MSLLVPLLLAIEAGVSGTHHASASWTCIGGASSYISGCLSLTGGQCLCGVSKLGAMNIAHGTRAGKNMSKSKAKNMCWEPLGKVLAHLGNFSTF